MTLVNLPDLVLVKIFRHLVHETNNFHQREVIDEVSLSQFTDLRSVKWGWSCTYKILNLEEIIYFKCFLFCFKFN